MNATVLNSNDRQTETTRLVNFYCAAPAAQHVELVGDFHQWQPLPMEHWLDGWWIARVPLGRGSHQYFYRVDGRPALDPYAAGIRHNDRDQAVSFIAVS